MDQPIAACTCSVDVAIVGGGPAGTAAALTLLRYSTLRVAVIERGDYHEPRVGETIPPSLQPLLHYLGVWDEFVAAGHLPAFGTGAVWGSPQLSTRDFLFTGRGAGWHLDRQRFDRMLAEAVIERGGRLLRATRLLSCARTADGWRLEVAPQVGSAQGLAARFVIDASGKAAAVARRLGAQPTAHDRLVGVVGFFAADGESRRQHALIEACADGWWYSAALPDGRLVAALMSDADLVRDALAADGWEARLAQTTATRERVGGARLAGPPIVRPAQSQLLQPCGGPGWIAAGDAAAAFDPLAAMGIGHAVTSGCHAARAAHDALCSDGTLLPQYAANLAQNFAHYLQLRREYYLLEQRWPDQPFWSRRHQHQAALAVNG